MQKRTSASAPIEIRVKPARNMPNKAPKAIFGSAQYVNLMCALLAVATDIK